MMRTTQQREAIRLVVDGMGRPLSTREILALARREVPRLGIATVYRNLKALCQAGKIVAVELPGQPPRWEAAPADHHHHFLCHSCDKLYEINACPEDIARLLPEGYTLEKHDILLHGRCAACATGVGQPAEKN